MFVTASAGTGKTAVLSGRCVSIVSDAALVPGRDEHARADLHGGRRRADARPHRPAASRGVPPDPRPHLLRQLILLQGANISTIHSFCKRLITEHFHKLALDPSFRVIDADEAMLLKGETLEETIEWAWRQDHLVQGMHELLQRRDLRGSDGFLGSVIRLSDFLEGVVTPDAVVRPGPLAGGADRSAGQRTGPTSSSRSSRTGSARSSPNLRLAKMLYEDQVPDGKWGGTMAGEPDRADRRLPRPVEREELARLRRGDSQLPQATTQLAQGAAGDGGQGD